MPVPRFRTLQAINQTGNVACAKTVIDIDHGYAARAAVEHTEKRREAAKTCAVADAGGDGDHRDVHEPADDAREGALHASHNDHHVRGGPAHEPGSA